MVPELVGEVTRWMERARRGDDEAIARLWNRCHPLLERRARRMLGECPDPDVAIEVASSAFLVLYRGLASGRYHGVRNRRELWALLGVILHHKAQEYRRHQGRERRGGGWTRLALESTAEVSAAGADVSLSRLVIADLMALLPDEEHRLIASGKLEGYTTEEIAKTLNCSESTVKRKLDLIRECWIRHVS